MRTSLLIAVATISLLSACREGGQANNAAANDAAASANAAANSATPAAAPVNADEAQRLFNERHEGMEAIGKATKTIKQALDSGTPDMAAIQASAARINELAGKSSGWFPAGTGHDVLPKTRAKDEIWQKSEDFAAKDRDLQQAAQALNAAAAAGDLAAVKARFADLGKTCKACHDSYRAPEHPK